MNKFRNVGLSFLVITEREEPFSSNAGFNNALYYAPVSAVNMPIELPEQASLNLVSAK